MEKIDWSKMKNLLELTLVMPTYNRQMYAMRQMSFWSGSPVTLHVLDGSNIPMKEENLEKFEDNVKYHHMPCSYEKRFGSATNLIDTQYVATLCDDEFFIPSALEKCIEFLKKNKDFVSCIGCLLRFNYINMGISAVIHEKNMRYRSTVGNKKKERMMDHINNYVTTTLYAVQRSEVWKKSMSIFSMNNYEFSNPYIVALMNEISTCYQGKSMVIAELMWLRSEENAPAHGESRKLITSSWLKDKKYETEVLSFYDRLKEDLPKIYNGEKEVVNDFKSVINSIPQCDFDIGKTKIEKLKRCLASLLSVRNEYRINLILANLNLNGWLPWKKIAKKLEGDGIHVDLDQLEEIVESIEEFHNVNG